MVLQLRGACGGRQIPNAEVLHWAPIYGNAMVLTN
jgi:hypothetical protein